MAETQTGVDSPVAGGMSPSVAGGIVVAVLALLHLYVLGVGGVAGILLLFVLWPLVGGVVSGFGFGESIREPPLAGAIAGAYAAFVVSLVVLLTGFVGAWSGFITVTFGVSLWPVVFTVFLISAISWTVFGYVGGYAVSRSSEAAAE